jgi:hypothetical protein
MCSAPGNSPGGNAASNSSHTPRRHGRSAVAPTGSVRERSQRVLTLQAPNVKAWKVWRRGSSIRDASQDDFSAANRLVTRFISLDSCPDRGEVNRAWVSSLIDGPQPDNDRPSDQYLWAHAIGIARGRRIRGAGGPVTLIQLLCDLISLVHPARGSPGTFETARALDPRTRLDVGFRVVINHGLTVGSNLFTGSRSRPTKTGVLNIAAAGQQHYCASGKADLP